MLPRKEGRCLIYALGEILLIVFGVLIALQVDNWNERRKEKAREERILLSLAEDFRMNSAALDSTQSRIADMQAEFRRELSYVGIPEAEYSQQMYCDLRRTDFIVTRLVDGALQSLLNSEKLELIRNEELKKRLTAYPGWMTELEKLESLIEDYVLEVQRPLLRDQYLSFVDLLPETGEYQAFQAKAPDSDYEDLLRDRRYQNILVDLGIYHSRLSSLTGILQGETQAILRMLEKEIGGTGKGIDQRRR